jgi:hypothetical protein
MCTYQHLEKIDMKLTWDQAQKYDWVHIEGGDRFYLRHNRTICQLEQGAHVALQLQNNYWRNVCQPLIQQIREKGGRAHCHVTHQYEGDVAPWWEYRVDSQGLSHKWIEVPKKKVNLKLGQSYYERSQWSNVLSARFYRINYVFWHKLDAWFWKAENKPKRAGDILKLTINDRLYFFAAGYNIHGVVHWEKMVDPSSVVEEVTMKD